MIHRQPPTTNSTFAVEIESRLRGAFERHEQRLEDGDWAAAALDAMCSEAQFRRMSTREIVRAIHRTWTQMPRPPRITAAAWTESYYTALGRCISKHVGE